MVCYKSESEGEVNTPSTSELQLTQSGVLRAPSAGCWFSLQYLISNCLTSCLHPGYIIVRRPPSCERHKSHSIQPVHSQSYILIFLDQMPLLFTQVHFLFWQLGRVGVQYATVTQASTNSISCLNLRLIYIL